MSYLKKVLSTSAPIMLGYLFLGIPCGILCEQVGLDAFQVFFMSMVFYSGAGQYMIPNMWLTGASIPSIIASVSLVNSRQLLYGASLSRFTGNVNRALEFLYGATVTDETFAVNLVKLEKGGWGIKESFGVNLSSQLSWACANAIGVIAGQMLSVPTAIASFAMTSIFLCLLFSQPSTKINWCVGIVAALGVVLCKSVGLTGPAILLGALMGIAAGFVVARIDVRTDRRQSRVVD